MSKAIRNRDAAGSKVKRSKDPRGHLDRVKKLPADGVRASSLGVAVLDSQTRFASVNDSLSRQGRAEADQRVGKTSREIVGDLAKQIEPTYEKVHVRDTPEFGYWLDHCFPILGRSGRVEQLGLFVVNLTAEKAARAMFDTLTTDSKRQMADAAGLLAQFDESIRRDHMILRTTFKDLQGSGLPW